MDNSHIRVLIADDSATARFFARRCLEAAGLLGADFREAADGALALAALKAEPHHLLVSDLMMPHIDGTALLERIRASPRLHDLPVIVISSAGNPARERQLKDLGALAVLAKPVSPASLAGLLATLFPGDNR